MAVLKKSPAFFNIGIIALLIVIISAFNCPAAWAENGASSPAVQPPQETQTASSWQKFAGIWQGDNDYAMMRLCLTVDVAGKTIYGSHKAIGQDVDMVDMVGEDTISITGFFASDSLAEVSYVSGYNPTDRSTGIARIALVDDNTIKWETTYRDGTSYIPYEIELKKIGPITVEPRHILFKNAWSVFDSKIKKQFALKNPMKNVTDILGAPKSKTLFFGSGTNSGNVYSYDGLEILAENDDSGEIVTYIHITSDRFITPGNLKVGDTAEKMVNLYGTIEKHRRVKEGNIEWYIYIVDKKNGFKSSFAVEGGIVKSIRFDMPTGWEKQPESGLKLKIKG